MKQIYKSNKIIIALILAILLVGMPNGFVVNAEDAEVNSGRYHQEKDNFGRVENVVKVNDGTLRLYFKANEDADGVISISELDEISGNSEFGAVDESIDTPSHTEQDADVSIDKVKDDTDSIRKDFYNSEIGLNIYVIVDNSETAGKVKDSLVTECSKLRENDTIYLYKAADKSDELATKLGEYNSENYSDLEGKLENISNDVSDNKPQNVYAAVCQVAEDISSNNSQYRNVCLIIADSASKDSSNLDNVYSSTLNHNLPIYYASPDSEFQGNVEYDEISKNTGGNIIKVDQLDSELFDNVYFKEFSFDNDSIDKTTDYTIVFDSENYHSTVIATITCADETQLTDDNNKIMESVKKNINLADSADSSSSSDSDQNSDKSKDSGKLSDATNSTASDASENDASPSEPEGKNDNGSSLKKILLIAIIAVIAILAVVIVIFVILSRKKKNNPVNGTQNPGGPGGNVNPAVNAVNQNVQMGGVNVYPPNTQMRNSSNNSVSVKPAPQYGLPIMLEIRIKGTVLQQIQTKINGSIIIGRSNICDVMIDNTTVSRQHFAMEYDGESIYIQDLNTKNGTYLNGVKLTHKRRIEKEDKIRVGSLEIIVRW